MHDSLFKMMQNWYQYFSNSLNIAKEEKLLKQKASSEFKQLMGIPQDTLSDEEDVLSLDKFSKEKFSTPKGESSSENLNVDLFSLVEKNEGKDQDEELKF